ncbi:MGMT family protein, partial [Salmonella enterica]|uniref:MGMT family protein n=1 Tax=Salmonella enterica TaxID=28901 RepID=UPI00398C5814
MLVSCASGLSSPLIPDYPEALTQASIMDLQETFPQRVWQILATIPAGFGTTYGDCPRHAGSPRASPAVAGG